MSLADVERLARAAGTELHNEYGHALRAIRAVTSEDAATGIEAALRYVPGVTGVSVSIQARRVQVEFERSRTSAERLRQVLNDLGYPARPSEGDGHHDGTWYARNKEFVWSLASGALLAVAWAGETWLGFSHVLAVALYLAAYGFGGFDLIAHLVEAARKGQFRLDIDHLILLAAVGAAVLGEWVEGAFLLFLFSLAHALEHYALGRARNANRALADLAPAMTRVRRDGAEREVPVEQVLVGETVIVLPAQQIPVDGTVHAGRSAVDQATITGESVPVEKALGD